MAAIILPSRRIVQPQGTVEVDWGNPLALGANVWTPQRPFALQSANTIQPGAEIAYSSAPISSAGVGRQWTRSANAGINFGLQQIIRQNVGVTVLVLAAPRSQTALKVPFSQRVTGGAFTQTELVFNCQDIAGITTATAGSVLLASYHNIGTGVAAASQIDGQPHCWVAGNSSTSGYIFRDGVNQTLAVNVRTPATLTISTQRTRIGNVADDGGTTWPHDDPLYLVVVWDRMLSDSEARAVSANPFQLFRPIQRRIIVSASAGGAIHDLSATAQAEAAASAALSVAKPLDGAGAAQATATAALLKGVSLTAVGLAVASGSASVSHTVPLQASAAAIAVAGAQMALAVTLGAAGLAVASATAALTVGNATDLAADGQTQASATAVLSLSVRLSGAAVSQALASASLAVGKTLTASGAAQAAGSADLQVGSGAMLTAAGTAQASASATLQLLVPISAAALAQALASGSLQLTVPLSAAAFAQSSSSGEFAGDVQMSAQGVAMASSTAALLVTGAYARAPEGSRFYESSGSVRPAREQLDGRPLLSSTVRAPTGGRSSNTSRPSR